MRDDFGAMWLLVKMQSSQGEEGGLETHDFGLNRIQTRAWFVHRNPEQGDDIWRAQSVVDYGGPRCKFAALV